MKVARTFDDRPVDQLVWETISDSAEAADFRHYLSYFTEGLHIEEATGRLVALVFPPPGEEPIRHAESLFPAAIERIEKLAGEGDPLAQFHLGKLKHHGIGTPKDIEGGRHWWQLAALQGDYRSRCNLVLTELELTEGDPKAYAEAALKLTRLADEGVPIAQAVLGEILVEGKGGQEPDVGSGWILMLEAAKSDEPKAALRIAHRCLGQSEEKELIRVGAAIIRSWAETGIAEACSLRAYMFMYGIGEATDPKAAFFWNELAARKGDPKAQYRLGSYYEAGIGTDKNPVEALQWYKLAAARDNIQAQANLADMFLEGRGAVPNVSEGMRWLLQAAEGGHDGAQLQLGEVFARGQFGYATDHAKARDWYLRSAKQGNGGAQFWLGINWAYGDGVERDDRQAMNWLNLAALQGIPRAWTYMGELLAKDQDNLEVRRKAVAYYRRAAEAGDRSGQFRLGEAYAYGDDVEKDFAEAGYWLSSAAEAGDDRAACILGDMFLFGLGVRRDPVTAMSWFRSAADNGHAFAKYRIGTLYENGDGVEANIVEAAKWFKAAADEGIEKAIKWLAKHPAPVAAGMAPEVGNPEPENEEPAGAALSSERDEAKIVQFHRH